MERKRKDDKEKEIHKIKDELMKVIKMTEITKIKTNQCMCKYRAKRRATRKDVGNHFNDAYERCI
jgi:hypothetical protein